MAPRKPRRSSSARKPRQNNTKPDRRKRKTKRTFTATSPVALEVSAVSKGSDQPPNGPDQFMENRLDSPHSISLNNLVRLDWQHRREMFTHGPGTTKLEQLGLKGRPYAVESLEPGTTGNKFVYLYPERRYYVVPIYEEGQSPDAAQRFLLVRSRIDKDEQGPHIFVVEPVETSAPDDPFAHLHIIGGEDDNSLADPHQNMAGIVEAVLTPIETAPKQAAESPAPPPPQPLAPTAPSAAEPLDEDLLSSIDVLSIAQSSRPDAAKDFEAAHNKFLGYVQKRYGLDNISITPGHTKFDPALGHSAATIANNPALPEGIIIGVLRDGYRRDQKVVRDAHVVVNKPDGTAARLQDTGQTALKSSAPPETPQGPDKPDDTLLRCIDRFNQAIGYRPAAEQDLAPLRNCLLDHLHQKYSWELIPTVLNTTQFDEKQGHTQIGMAYLSQVGDGVIVAVEGNGYTSDDKVVRNAQVIVNRIPSHIAQLNKLVSLSRKQMYLEIVARQDMIIDEVIHDAANQVGVIDVIYSLLTILATASTSRIRYLAEQMSNGAATSSLIRENLGRTPPLHLRYLRRTPEMYVALRGAIQPLDTLRQILISEAARRNEKNYYLQADRTWLGELLCQLRPAGLTADDYKKFAEDIARRLEQITFTREFVANTAR